jgi:hypothetical protein
MVEYRLYFVDPGGRICRSVVFEGDDDDDAIRTAWRHACEHDMELWNPAGLVAKFSPLRDGELSAVG